VLPFRVTDGGVDVASPEVPSEEMSAALRAFLVLEVRFHLVTPTMFQRLTETLL
jgi:hypothetical protein